MLKLLTHYYIKEPKLVEQFNHEPSKFNFEAYVRECP